MLEKCILQGENMKDYLNCIKIETAIRRAKNMLIAKAKLKGLYENFGNNECREIEAKFIDSADYFEEMNKNRDKIKHFRHWCSTYKI